MDPARFRGRCYRAANWIAVGRTRGYGHVRGTLGYRFHGQPKEVFVYPLRRRAPARLSSARHPIPHLRIPAFEQNAASKAHSGVS